MGFGWSWLQPSKRFRAESVPILRTGVPGSLESSNNATACEFPSRHNLLDLWQY
jgi:hypothetical protein